MRSFGLVSLITLVLLGACSSKTHPPLTGFLNTYEGLEAISPARTHLFSKHKDVNLSSYTKLLVPEIQVIALSERVTPYDRELYAQVSAYGTAGYRKLISKHSSNYELVDVAQKGALVMEVGLSIVELEGDDIDHIRAIPLIKNPISEEAYTASKARLLVEVRTSDALTQNVLTRSMQLIIDAPIEVKSEKIRFRDLQAALDRWLSQVVRY